MPPKGQHPSLETLKRMSNSLKGRQFSPEWRAKISMGNKGKKRSLEARANYSASKKGPKNPNYGKHYPPEYCVRMSLALSGCNNPNFGRHFSLEVRNKISESLKGPNHFMYGKHHTEETKRKLSASHIGDKNSMYGRKGILNPFYGKHHTKETNHKNSELHKGLLSAMKGKHHTEQARRKIIISRSKQIFPKRDTKIEIKIQDYLKTLEVDFETHNYMNIKHAYQCDIYIPSQNLVIECDGDYWHCYPIGREIDCLRTQELVEKGYKVVRLWEHEINEMTMEEFKKKIQDYTMNPVTAEFAVE